MGFRKFLTSIIKNIIILLVATLIFSTITLDFPTLTKGIFEDIFAYASPEVQKNAVSRLAESCSALGQGQELVAISKICANRTLLESMEENCASYRELKKRGIKIEDESQAIETCQKIESGELERACEELSTKKSIMPDFSKIGSLCKEYKDGKINDKEFFFNAVSGAIPSQMQLPDIGFLEKYNDAITSLNNNKLIYFTAIFILLILLYLLLMDIKLFILTLTGISLSIGILIMLPYFAIVAYENFVGIDTTSILGSLFGLGNFDLKAILSVILLLFLRTYNNFIITAGILFLAVGIAGKVYGFILKGKSKAKKIKTKTKKKK